MVARKPRDRAVSHEIKPAIADMRKEKLLTYHRKRRTRRSHAAKARMFVGILLNACVGHIEGLNQSGFWIVLESTVVDLAHGLDRQTAGFLATLVPAHAISDHGQTALAPELVSVGRLPVKVGILIVFPNPPDVA